MGPRVDPVISDTDIPPRTTVVVIGGGIIGVSAAYALARKGTPVVLCEKGHIGGEQSSRNWGWCRKMGRDPREIPLIIESLRLWQGMNEAVGAETGFRTTGIVYLCETEKDETRRSAWLEHARPYQLDTRMIGPDEIDRLMPGATRRFRAALYTPSDGRAEPQKATPAIAEAARRAGAIILTDCAVRGLETSGGRVVAAVTEKGRIACDSVLLAGGAWSRLFCGNAGLDLKQLKVRSSVMRTEALEGAPEISASGAEFGFRKRLDGGYTIANLNASVTEIVPDSFRLARDFLPLWRSGQATVKVRLSRRFMEEARTPRRWSLDTPSPFETTRVLDPDPITALNDRALASLTKAFPAFAQARVAQQWAGMIDVTPDAVPVISPVDSMPGFFIATGFSGHGFGIGPAAGRLAADLITGDQPIVDPTPFRFDRFTGHARSQPMIEI
ncbi:MAG TPA: FAD-binding oxidoreductase [Acetobacteraceae bacterium]|nr:FAD-binding oxidoreductase [Acetobacteraceae bacterium]